MGRCLVLVAALAACTKSNPGATCSSGTCSDPRYPFCDATGAIGGTPGACIAVTCQPGEIHSCDGNQAWTCNAAGDGYDLTACSLGCSDQPMPHCKYLQPRYLPNVCDTPAQTDQLAVTNSGMIDPNLDQTCTGGVESQPSAPDLCVAHYHSITVASGATLTIAGKSDTHGRAVALVADNDVDIAGVLDVSAHVNINGPGGGTIASGMSMTNAYDGAGGAGGATAGGAGGSTGSNGSGTDGGAQNGGPPTINPALLAALTGGAADELGGPSAPQVVGGGGGALTVISCHGTVNVTGVINAGGGGGQAGMFVGITDFGGWGGGAGGNIVLQGTNISVTGSLFSNGGAGASGMYDGANGMNGADGSMSDTAAALGGVNVSAGAGGAGGFAGAPPGPGRHPTDANSTAGGGGGSVGFIQVYVPAGVTPTITPSHVSPALQPTGTALTR